MQHQILQPSMRRLAGLALMSCGLVGCRDEGFSRYPVKGTVTYQGKPVDAGMIIFEPTESAGAVAPTSYLPIMKGIYDAGSEGPTKGKYRVTIGGYDHANEKKDGEGMVYTPSLFPDYKFEVEIPPPDNKLDIEVPAKGSSRADK